MYDIQLTSHHVKEIFKQIELTIYLDFRKVVAQSCLAKNVFLKISQNSQETTVVQVSFLIKRLPQRSFSCEFYKIHKNTFFTEHLRTSGSWNKITISLFFLNLQIWIVTFHSVESVQIRRFFFGPYSVHIQENTDQKKLRIWTLLTQYLGCQVLKFFRFFLWVNKVCFKSYSN